MLLLGVYALLLVASPLLHHDLACHLKSPTHCDACVAHPMASRVERVARIDASVLAASFLVNAAPRAQVHSGVPLSLPSRAPPASL